MARAYNNLHVLVFIRLGNLLLLLLFFFSLFLFFSLQEQMHRHWHSIYPATWGHFIGFYWLSLSFVLIFRLAYILYLWSFVVWIVGKFVHHIFIVSTQNYFSSFCFYCMLCSRFGISFFSFSRSRLMCRFVDMFYGSALDIATLGAINWAINI